VVEHGWSRYRWEFANPKNRVPVNPDGTMPPGVYQEPAHDGFWMRGDYQRETVQPIR
jgi:hypothetical protein